MSFKFETVGLKEVEKMLGGFSKQLPYVTMLTLNDLAFATMYAIKAEVKVKLNLRSNTIPNAFRVKKATKSRLVSEVFIDDSKWQADILKPHFNKSDSDFPARDRGKKGLEKAMISAGHMSSNEILTPSPGVKIQYRTYKKMLSLLRSNGNAGSLFFLATKKSKRTRHLHPGIYARVDGGVRSKPIMILRISAKPDYSKRFDLEETAVKVYNRSARELFRKNADKAIRTAR